jgi:hypothetical protein
MVWYASYIVLNVAWNPNKLPGCRRWHRNALFFYGWGSGHHHLLPAIDVQVLLASKQVGSTTGCMCALRQWQYEMVLKCVVMEAELQCTA